MILKRQKISNAKKIMFWIWILRFVQIILHSNAEYCSEAIVWNVKQAFILNMIPLAIRFNAFSIKKQLENVKSIQIKEVSALLAKMVIISMMN